MILEGFRQLGAALARHEPQTHDSWNDRTRRAMLAALFIELCPHRKLHDQACAQLGIAAELALPGVAQALKPLRAHCAGARGNPWWLGQVYEQLAGVELAASAPGSLPHTAHRAARKARGCFYTPPSLARHLAACGLAAIAAPGKARPRVLDPAMGAGAFLLAAVHELEGRIDPGRSSSKLRRELVEACLCGVELDPLACCVAQLSLQLFVGEPPIEQLALGSADALWGARSEDIMADPVQGWRQLFPGSGTDFDLVLCNPPYLGERGRKALFRPLRAQYPEVSGPRMDYWYFFVGLALRLTRSGGAIGMLTPSYWLRAAGARQLRARIRACGDLESLLDFGRYPVFPEARGQHSSVWLLRLSKQQGATTRCVTLGPRAKKKSLPEVLEAVRAAPASIGQLRWRACDDLLAGPGGASAAGERRLGELVELRQGIVPNPDRLSARAASQLNMAPGVGVFLLHEAEVVTLGLRPEADAQLVPAFRNSDIRSFAIDRPAGFWLLYLRTEDVLEQLPAVRRHLERFRPLLEKRREVQRGRIAWYSLHWPRQRAHFERPRLVTSNWGNGPRPFALESGGCFERRDVTSLHLRAGCDWSLDALLGFLNSTTLRGRVDALELGYQRQAELAAWPLPSLSGDDPAIKAVAAVAGALRIRAQAGPLDPASALWAELEECVAAAYRR